MQVYGEREDGRVRDPDFRRTLSVAVHVAEDAQMA